MMLLQIKVRNRKNSSVIHAQAPVMLKYIQLILYLKLLFLKLLKDMIITPNNWSLTVITIAMMDGVKSRRELQVSQILFLLDEEILETTSP